MTAADRKELTDCLDQIIEVCDNVIPGSRFEAFLEGGGIATLRPDVLKDLCVSATVLLQLYTELLNIIKTATED